MKNLKVLALIIMASLVFVSCSKDNTTQSNTKTEQTSNSENSSEKVEEKDKVDEKTESTAKSPTAENPLIIDENNKEVRIFANVNPKFKKESTMHMVVASTGKNKDVAMFTSLADQNNFYSALEKIGATAGNNVTMDNMGKEYVKGDKIKMEFKFEGSEEYLDAKDVINDSSNKEIDIRFGGNQKPAKDMNTGCITCMQSCPLGITSNATHLMGEDEKDGVKYTLKDSVPEDKPVIIVYKLDK